MSIVFLTSSLLTTVQDLGRTGYRRFGVNPNGAMDRMAAKIINILLNNDETESVLEMHFPAPKIQFEENALIALGGAKFGAQIGERKIENWRPVFVEKGSVLSFPEKLFGNRAYLAIKGGFQIEKWLESASTNLKAKAGGFQGRSIQKGDKLSFTNPASNFRPPSTLPFRLSKGMIPHYSHLPTVRVIAGAEFEKLTKESQRIFKTRNFTIRHESDRMGFRLRGENLKLKEQQELISSAVGFGTIQLLPDGQMIILMADHQTTGGYPRIAHVISKDLPLIAQLGANDKLNFAFISIEDAENLLLHDEIELNYLKIGISEKFRDKS